MNTPPPAVEITGLRHRYPKAPREALAGIDLTVPTGEALALLGPNGGGKSTTFKIIATLLKPTAGHVRVLGQDIRTAPAAARAALGVVFQNPSVDPHLTAAENMTCQARLYGLSRTEAASRTTELLKRFDLVDRHDHRVETFSGGLRRRLEIAKALLHNPTLLLMDEPATGLDPAARRALWTQVAQLRQERNLTVLWTTHLLDEAQHADRVAILTDGKLLTVATPAQVQDRCGGQMVSVEPTDPADLPRLLEILTDKLGPWPNTPPRSDDTSIRFEHPQGPAIVARISQQLAHENLRRISVGRPTLEDAYLRLHREKNEAQKNHSSADIVL
ncbi:MAG: ABC transporter ATP-binding protein [Algisphaera sp.]